MPELSHQIKMPEWEKIRIRYTRDYHLGQRIQGGIIIELIEGGKQPDQARLCFSAGNFCQNCLLKSCCIGLTHRNY